ncbi:MAG: alpha-L-rhamnosidase [Ruminococcaceae bacterium]|nr:alpha-L-rhamnosidase [Oscillospiraceae bacterium]
MFISHPDFYNLEPFNLFHKDPKTILDPKQAEALKPPKHPAHLLNRHILFRKKVTLPAFSRAVLNISADDHYKLYINGRFVTEGPAASYPNHYFYNELDVSEYLTEGENCIAVHTYYQGLINHVWVSGDLRQMLWCELSLDGQTVLESDESWLTANHTGYTESGRYGYDTGIGECYDASVPEADFYKPDFDDSAFMNAKEHRHPEWKLVKQPTKQLDIYDVEPETTETIEGGVRLAFHTEAVGTLMFDAVGQKGDEIVIRYGEELNADGSVRFEMRCNCRYEEKMILSGGSDSLMNFDYKAFRYVEILYPESVKVENIRMRVRHYPFAEGYAYQNDNETLRSVIDLCRNTVKYSTQDTFLDCPTREKGSYLGDLMVSGRAHASLTGDLSLIKHALECFTRTAFISEGLMAIAGGSAMHEIADYSFEFPAVLAWIYSIDHDLDFLKKCAPYAVGVYNYYKKYENADGLVDRVLEWNLMDWPQNLRDNYDFPLTRPIGEGVHNVINALWYGMKLALEEISSILGENADYGSEKTKASFIKTFYNKETGLFADAPGSSHTAVHSSVFTLLFGIGTEDEALKARLIAHIREKKLTSMGVYMAYFALAALKKAGRYDLCIELATDSGAWPNMVKEGATLTFEAWGKDQKWNTSLCHPWATAPLIIFSDAVRPY